jgi:hypothetical protein
LSASSFWGATGSPVFPLTDCYGLLDRRLPDVCLIQPDEIPEAERRLLVHDRDLTPVLEAAHGCTLHIRALACRVNPDIVSRLVVLELDRGSAPAGMGAIRIHLEHLPRAACSLIKKHRQAFGAILRATKVSHYGRPTAYFRLVPDSLISDALRTTGAGLVYGRRNTIWNDAGAALAEVVEILAPAANFEFERS